MIKRFCYETDKHKAYQQALDDFGITELLEKLSNYSDKDFDSTWMSLEEEEVSNLAAILISSLAKSLDGKLIAQHLSAVDNGNQNILPVPLKLEVPFLPIDFCDRAKSPRFVYGDKLRWLNSGSNPDWGTVIGRFYSFAPHLYDWTWCYQIWLNEDSPSAAWVSTDIAWEQDLEPFEEEVNL
jgi:hypothetical protein